MTVNLLLSGTMGCSECDQNEKTKIFWSSESKSWEPGANGLAYLAAGIVNSVLNLPEEQVKLFGEIQTTEVLRQIV